MSLRCKFLTFFCPKSANPFFLHIFFSFYVFCDKLDTSLIGGVFLYNIIVIDDHQMLRDMISETLNSKDDLNVVATSGNAKDSLELCKKLNPDLVLMDVCTENNSNGIAYSKLLKKQFPNVKVIIMTGILDLNFINDAKEAGVDSFIYKNISKDSLIMTIKNTLDGYSMYPNDKNILSKNNILSDLTEAELKVLTLYCKLLDRDEVANKLGISTRTLQSYISSIYSKTGYNNLAKLSIFCVSSGLIVPNLESPEE